MKIRYRELAEQLKKRILGGLYRKGQKLPSLRQLSQEYAVSIGTVQNAYIWLERQQLITAAARSGYFVCYSGAGASETGLSGIDVQPVSIANWGEVSRFLTEPHEQNGLELGRGMPHVSSSTLEPLMRYLGAEFKGAFRSSLYYESIKGFEPLRVEVTRQLVDAGVRVSAAEVIITSGAQEALSCVMRVMCQAGDIVAMESPIFHGVIQTLKAQGVKVLEIPCDSTAGIDLDLLRVALGKYRISAIVVNPTCNNPLGFSMPRSKREALIDLAVEHDFHIIEDDTYADLCHAYPRPASFLAYEHHGRVVTCGSFSKTLGPGLRLGWVIPGAFYEKVLHEKYVSSGSTFTAGQKAVAQFMRSGEYQLHLRRMRERYSRNLLKTRALLARHIELPITVSQPIGGYYLWVELPHKVTGTALNHSLRKHSIQIGSGSVFSVSGRYANCIRINCSGNIDGLFEAGVMEIGKALSALQAACIELL